MNDSKLENRKDNFRKCNINILEHREKFNLSLRKQKLDNLIMNKRIKTKNFTENFLTLEINPSKLSVDSKFLANGIRSLEEDEEVIINMLASEESDYVKYAVYNLRLFSSHSTDSLSKLPKINDSEKSIIDALANKLQKVEDQSLIFEIYWILVNFTMQEYEDTSHYDIFCTDEMIQTFLRHFKSNQVDIVDNLLWFFSHLVGENVNCRDNILNSQIYDEVKKILNRNALSLDMIISCLWFISQLMKFGNPVPPEEKILECLSICNGYLSLRDLEVGSYCLWGLSYISNFDNCFASVGREMLKNKLISQILQIDFNKNNMYLKPSVILLGNLCAGRQNLVDELLKLNVLSFFEAVSMCFPNFRKDLAWSVANITAGNYMQVEEVINSPMQDQMMVYLKEPFINAKREALYAINNCVSTNCYNICSKLVQKGIIPILCEILTNNNCETILTTALEALKHIFFSAECEDPNPFLMQFEENGGHTILEKLQMHSEPQVFEFSNLILKTFYKTSSDDL